MDVIILAAGLATRLNKYTHNIIPKYLINLDNNTGLYYIIQYWDSYAKNIYLVIHSKFNSITKFYIENLLHYYSKKIIIINYDSNDGTAYTLNYILKNTQLKDKIDENNLLLTWCDLYPTEKINFDQISKNSSVTIMTYGNNCRYRLNRDNNVEKATLSDGNIVGIYYFHNCKFTIFPYEECKGKDIVEYLENIGTIQKYELEGIID